MSTTLEAPPETDLKPQEPNRSFNFPSLGRAVKMVQRNLVVYRHTWMVIFSGFFEPLFYLVAVGYGLGRQVGTLPFNGQDIPYQVFVAPGMLAASCLNGAITDGFFNPFFKLHIAKTYDGILATPMTVPDIALGEMFWAQIRGSLYSAGFLLIMLPLDLILSPWAILAFPAAMLVAGACSAGAMVLTATVKGFEAFDKVFNLIVFPLFLFSGTFFPIDVYPEPLQWFAHISPLYHGANLLRSLTTGLIQPDILTNIIYLVVMFLVCITYAMRQLERKLIL